MSWPLFDRIRALARSSNLYAYERVLQDQPEFDRIVAGGEFLNFRRTRSLLEQTNLQINKLERYKDYDQMDEVGEIQLALDLYADEGSLIDPELKHSIMVKCPDKTVKEDIEDFLYNTIMIDRHSRPWLRYLCKYGDAPFEIVPTRERDGVAALRLMDVYNFTRVETKYGDLVGFFHQNRGEGQATFLHPWQVMHTRLGSEENVFRPYGRSILDGGRKHFKQLRLMEDAALIYRVTRAPEKRIFTIPVGNIPTNQVPGFIASIARQFKKKQFFDPGTGDVNERYSPQIQEDDFWLPQRPDGSGPSIDTLPGAQNLDDIKDIEYFKKKMVAALKIPFSRVGIGDSQGDSSRPLAQTAPDFAKAVQWIQREFCISLKKVIIVHLMLRGYDTEQLREFDLYMTASSAIDELYRIETWSSRADIISALKDTELFTDRWILRRFTDMTDDEIEELEQEKSIEKEYYAMMGIDTSGGGFGGGGGGGGGLSGLGGGGGLGDIGGIPQPGGMASGDPAGAGMGGAPGPGMDAGSPGLGGGGGLGESVIHDKSLILENNKRVINTRMGVIRENRVIRDNARINSNYDGLLTFGEFDMIEDKNKKVLVQPVISEGLISSSIGEAKILIENDLNIPNDLSDSDIELNDLPHPLAENA